MQYGQNSAGTQPVPIGPELVTFLKESGLHSEAALAETAKQDPAAQAKLERSLRPRKPALTIPRPITAVEQLLRLMFGNNGDVTYRKLQLEHIPNPVLMVGLVSMTDRQGLQFALPTLLGGGNETSVPQEPDAIVDLIAGARLAVSGVQVEHRLSPIITALLNGEVAIFVDGATRALCLAVPGWKTRSIQEPETEVGIRGPREGFTESYTTNVSLLRRRIRDEQLQVDAFTIGRLTHTSVGLIYLRGVCRPALIDEAKRRLTGIDVDGVIDSAYIEEFIEDTPWTVFPQVVATERPDVVAAGILEGRFAIIVEGSPFALVAPVTYVDMMQAPDDYYDRFPLATFLRVLRWGFASFALIGPSLYVAFTTFHQEMVPTSLLLSIMAAREGVPFPAVIEAMLMEITFEALREAGLRLPKNVGQTVSILGALVIGESAVNAGIVSAPMVIVVSITGIASFLIPKYSGAIALRILRFPLLILAGTFGAYGIALGLIAMFLHLLSLRSFGVPYYAPLGPFFPDDQQDVIVRAPRWAMRNRPVTVESLNPVRVRRTQPTGLKGKQQQ